MKFADYIITSSLSVTEEVYNIRESALSKLQELTGSNKEYPQPREWLSWVFQHIHEKAEASLVAALSTFYLELDSLAELVDYWENEGYNVNLVTNNKFVAVKNKAGDNFEIYNDGFCVYGRHAVNPDDYDYDDIYYVCIPTIEAVIADSKNLVDM